METAADSLNTPLLKRAVEAAGKSVREGPAALRLAEGFASMFPGLAIDMIEVGESTGALPAMLNSVAEFFEEDVNTRMTADAVADRAGHHDRDGLVRGLRFDFVVSADLFAGGHDSVELWRLLRNCG